MYRKIITKQQANMCFKNKKNNERGAALAIVLIIVAILAVIAMTALAFSSSEARIAGKDLQRSQTFYAAVAAIEKMTSDFSDLFREKINPTPQDLDDIEIAYPAALVTEGFSFSQTLEEDTARLQQLQAIQGLPPSIYPRVNIPNGPYAGLYASIIPYKMSSIATMTRTGTEVELERDFNNYLVPMFQFGIFSNEDLEFAPGPMLTFNGRIHGNKNIYALRNIKFLNRISTAGEFVRDAKPSGVTNSSIGNNEVYFQVNGFNVRSTLGNGSVKPGGGYVGGPNFPSATAGMRGFHPGSPNGVPNTSWEANSTANATGANNLLGGQILTNTTGATELKMPIELSGNSPAELIKRSLPSDSEVLSTSRYHTKSQVRILIDDYNAGSGAANVAGIPAGKGVLLRNNSGGFDPIPLDGGNALRRVNDSGGYIDAATIKQRITPSTITDAKTVRGIKTLAVNSPDFIPAGSGIEGKILIEVIRPDGTEIDVTTEILSMGMTVGEPNGIVYLQRPMWAAFVQGSRDRNGNNFDLANLTRNYQEFADGEIVGAPTFDGSTGLLSLNTILANDDLGVITRENSAVGYNSIYPITLYNVREGWYQSSMDENDIYERGLTSVIDINMRNLARWLDGIYDSNLLSGTNAVSTNIEGVEGYIVYISDRRGDQKRIEYLADGSNFMSTNGIVDNEDIYGPNNTLDSGEDVINFGWSGAGVSKGGTLQRDLSELPTTGFTFTMAGYSNDRLARGLAVLQRPINYFRRGVRLFDGETLSFSAGTGKLSETKGITVASENMVYIWGNYNTTGITGIPAGGSTLNDGGYTGPQIPASVVADAFFPLSKTWFDGLSAMRPEGSSDARNFLGTAYRMADENLPSTSDGTAVRAGIIGGTNISSTSGLPGRDSAGDKRNGGVINYPRFLEIWNLNNVQKTWSYSGSFIPIFHSTQAMAQWENRTSVIYMPPRRNWSFDQTFLTPNKLPPGTPFFQYVQATGFRQKLN